MKKLRVILPAILTLAVSTSAAVTGTVAWFTATRLRTVQMNNITAVNPEEGLNLVSITNRNNVIATNINESTGEITDKTVTPIVKQATYMFDHDSDPATDEQETAGYLRDASVDVEHGLVYKAALSEDGGTVTGYAPQSIATADTKTYNKKNIFYATSFTLNFNIARGDSGYEQHVFLDLNQSDVSTANAAPADAKNADIYHGLRIGLACGTQWFVWAPFTETNFKGAEQLVFTSEPANWSALTAAGLYTNADLTTGQLAADATYASGTYYRLNNNFKPKYVTSSSTVGNEQPYAETNFVIGNNTGTTPTDADIRDDSTPLNRSLLTTENGWLGKLAVDTETTAVTVYTWFEGLEPDVISDNFTQAITGLTSNLKFIMRRVQNA